MQKGVGGLKKQLQKGSVSVEAALFLSMFLMAFLTLINFARMTRAEVAVQHALNGSAMQISQYGYLLSKTGIIDSMGSAADKAAKTKADLNQVVNTISDLAGAVENVRNDGITQDSVNGLIAAAGNAEGAAGIVEGYFQNPKGLLTGIAAIVSSGAQSQASRFLISRMAKEQVKEYLLQYTEDPDGYLEGMGVVGGLSGLNFEKTKLVVAGGAKDLYITVTFRYKNNMFQDLDFGEHTMILNASTRLW